MKKSQFPRSTPSESDPEIPLSRRERRAVQRAHARAHRRRGLASGTLSAGAALAAGIGLHASPAHAATFEVTNLNDAGAGSLRDAIAQANALAGFDVITFQTGLTGTITLTSGQLSITDSVDIQGPGAEKLTISGNDASRVFYLYNYSRELNVVISGLTATHGRASIGGAIVNFDEDLVLDGVHLVDNTATGDGGGLWADGFAMDLTIRNSVISGNSAGSDGGGIYVEDTGGPLLIENTRITDNDAGRHGGGIYFYDPDHDVTISQTTISGNTAVSAGGGLFMDDTDGGEVRISESTISGNSAAVGGGLFLYGPDHPVTVEHSTISGNQATSGDGGGLFLNYAYASVTIAHSTIASNSATGKGGGVVSGHASPALKHTIVADNTATTDADISTPNSWSVRLYHSLVETPGAASLTDDGGNVMSVDPMLGALADNGGPTQTHLPGHGSPALDAGDPAFAAPPMTDQRGRERVGNGRIDIGAVERHAGTVQWTASSASVSEAGTTITLTAQRSGGSDGDIAVSYASADGTATSADYTAASGSLQWSNQDAANKSFSIAIANDGLIEDAETFTVTLSNPTHGAALGANSAITVTINASDAAPTISAIADVSIDEDTTTGAIHFTVNDADQDASTLVVTASSSNQALVPDANLVLGGTGSSRSVEITPLTGQFGSTTITVTVSDGTNQTSETFTLTVNQVDEPNAMPTISGLGNQTIDADGSTGELAFSVSDAETPAGDLVVTAVSSDQALLPDANIELGGSGSDRTIKLTPAAGGHGMATVTVKVSDGTHETSMSFVLTVTAAQEPGEEPGGEVTEPNEPSDMEPNPGSMPDAGTGPGDKPTTGEDLAAPRAMGGGGCSAAGGEGAANNGFASILLGLAAFVTRRRKRTS